jgi:hypothetical protein
MVQLLRGELRLNEGGGGHHPVVIRAARVLRSEVGLVALEFHQNDVVKRVLN